jgi:hypothetical protein
VSLLAAHVLAALEVEHDQLLAFFSPSTSPVTFAPLTYGFPSCTLPSCEDQDVLERDGLADLRSRGEIAEDHVPGADGVLAASGRR